MRKESEEEIYRKFRGAIIGDTLWIGNTSYVTVPGGWVVERTFVLDPMIRHNLRNRMDAIDCKLKALLDKDKS